MLINGDLVRVPQGTITYKWPSNVNCPSISVVTEPQYAVIISNKEEDFRILINNEVYGVNPKKLQLVESS